MWFFNKCTMYIDEKIYPERYLIMTKINKRRNKIGL